jgi:hypothetical protein
MPLLPPLLAVDVGGLIAIAFVIISFIGWISNLVAGQQKPQRPANAPRPRRPQDKRIRDEIDAFLQEAAGPQKRPPPRPAPPRREDVLAVDEPPQRAPAPRPQPPRRPPVRPQPPRPEPPPTPASSPAPSPPPSVRRVPGQELAQRHIGPTAVGSEVQQHVRQHMAERVATLAQQDVRPTVPQSVFQHLGSGPGQQLTGPTQGVASPSAGARDATPAADLIALLHQKKGLQQAFLLSEILQRPMSMRR